MLAPVTEQAAGLLQPAMDMPDAWLSSAEAGGEPNNQQQGNTMAVTNNTFTATGAGNNPTPATNIVGSFNLHIAGTFQGSVTLERRFDGDWAPVAFNSQGVPNSYSKPISFSASENEAAAQYRFVCTQLVSGSIVTRISN